MTATDADDTTTPAARSTAAPVARERSERIDSDPATSKANAEAVADAVRSPLDRAHIRDRASRKPTYPLVDTSRVGIAAPIDYSPDAVQGDDPAAVAARSALAVLHDVWSKVGEVAKDMTVPSADLHRVAQPAVERALLHADKAAATIAVQVERAEKQLQAKLAPEIDATLAAELRAWARGQLSGPGANAERTQEVVAAVQADARASSALLSAPAYLIGASATQHELIRSAATDAHASAEAAKLKAAKRVQVLVARAGRRLTEEMAPRLRQWSGRVSPLAKLEGIGRE